MNNDTRNNDESESVDPYHTSDNSNDPNYSSDSGSENSSDSGSEVPLQVEAQQGAEEVKRTRKRKRNKNEWEKNATKIARNSGKEYVSSSKSRKVMKPKKIKPPCRDKFFKFKCNSRVTVESRKLIFENYWALGESQKQRDYLSSCMTPIQPKYQYTKTG